MLRFLADENFNGHIFRGLRRAVPGLELIRVQDVGLMEADDDPILEWAAENQFIVISHDIKTMPGFAWARVRQHLPMIGLFMVPRSVGIGAAILDLAILGEDSAPQEWIDQVVFLPL